MQLNFQRQVQYHIPSILFLQEKKRNNKYQIFEKKRKFYFAKSLTNIGLGNDCSSKSKILSLISSVYR